MPNSVGDLSPSAGNRFSLNPAEGASIRY